LRLAMAMFVKRAQQIIFISVSIRCSKPREIKNFSFKIELYHIGKSLAAVDYNSSKYLHTLLGVVSVYLCVGMDELVAVSNKFQGSHALILVVTLFFVALVLCIMNE